MAGMMPAAARDRQAETREAFMLSLHEPTAEDWVAVERTIEVAAPAAGTASRSRLASTYPRMCPGLPTTMA